MGPSKKPRRIVCYTKEDYNRAKIELKKYRRMKRLKKVRKREEEIARNQSRKYRRAIHQRKQEIYEMNQVLKNWTFLDVVYS